MTHKPDTMIELSTRTKASYTYVKDWMMLRECLAGCLGAMQTLSHQNIKLKLRLPEGSPAKFHKISGALQIRNARQDVMQKHPSAIFVSATSETFLCNSSSCRILPLRNNYLKTPGTTSCLAWRL
jgi:hypothetical protein